MANTSDEKALLIVSDALNIPMNKLTSESGFDNTDQWDSLGHMRIILALEGEMGRNLSGVEIMQIANCADIARIIAAT